jgi:hypothetical protein
MGPPPLGESDPSVPLKAMAATPGSFDAYVDENEIADEDLAQGFRDWLAEPSVKGPEPAKDDGSADTSERDESSPSQS